MRIVDAHTHFTPPGTIEGFAVAGDEPYWQFLTTPDPSQTGSQEQGFITEDRMIAEMAADGIDQAWIHAGYRQSRRGLTEANDIVLGLGERHPDVIVPFVGLDPRDPAAAIDELDRALDRGARGVGELNPYAQGCRVDGPEMHAIAEACAERGIPLTLHMSEEAGSFYFGKSTPRLGEYYEFALRHPDLKLVLAHWGGGLFFFEMMPFVQAQLAHVSYDTAASPLLYPTEKVFAVALQCLAPEKILFGSDYPLRIVRDTDVDGFSPFLDQIRALDLPHNVVEALLHANADRLLDRNAPAAAAPASQGAGALTDEVAASRDLADRLELPLDPFASVRLVAERYPATRPVFERYGIPYVDSPVPVWEPIIQSAAARRVPLTRLDGLMEELQRAVGS